jgi:hypothetical protein
MGIRFQFFNKTAAQWTANNPILLNGELGLENDTQKFKMGDGATTWNALGYVSTGTLGDVRAADYLGVAPVWVPVGTLGIAKDTVTKQIWFYSAGAWE